MTVTHAALPDHTTPACGATDGIVVPLADVLHPLGCTFDCPECHKVLTGGNRHTQPPASGARVEDVLAALDRGDWAKPTGPGPLVVGVP